jgi:hypothetical protein
VLRLAVRSRKTQNLVVLNHQVDLGLRAGAPFKLVAQVLVELASGVAEGAIYVTHI